MTQISPSLKNRKFNDFVCQISSSFSPYWQSLTDVEPESDIFPDGQRVHELSPAALKLTGFSKKFGLISQYANY